MDNKNSSKVLSEKELEEVLGGTNKGGNNGTQKKVTRTCSCCGVTGPHTVYTSTRIVCDNCKRPSNA